MVEYFGEQLNGFIFTKFGWVQSYGKGKWEGDKYVGEFKEGKKHGQGIYIYSNGEIARAHV